MQSGAVPKECSDEHTVLLCSFTEGKQQLLCKLDKTVSLRQLYGLLCRCGFLKDSHDRMLLLEKVSKTLNPKSLRRESKTMPSSLDKLSSASP